MALLDAVGNTRQAKSSVFLVVIADFFKKNVALSFCCHCRGSQNVMGVEACIRHKDHVVIVMPYFHHDKFQVHIVKLLEIILYYEFVNTALKCAFTV